METLSCTVFSHRPTRFKFGYKINTTSGRRLKKRLHDEFTALYGQGVRRFYVGGCLGVDQWAGEVLLRLKEQPGFEDIELVIAAPFPNHDAKWDDWSRNQLHFLISHCTEHLVIGKDDRPESFVARNQYMLSQADVLMAVYDNDRTVRNGVGQVVLSAEKKGLPVVFIHPDTGIISVQGKNPQQSNQFVLVDFPSK